MISVKIVKLFCESYIKKFHKFIKHSCFSYIERLGRPLDEHVLTMPKVKVFRNSKREGLVRARLRGAREARGDVLTFLDSHCEATPGWAEPLLARIYEDEKNVVCPSIEVLNADTFAYQASANAEQRGGFNWDLFFKWKGIPPEEQKLRKDESDPIRLDIANSYKAGFDVSNILLDFEGFLDFIT